MRPIPLEAANLGAVVPGFRSLNGLGLSIAETQPGNCLPPGVLNVVASRCADGSIMPVCGAGTCPGSGGPGSVQTASIGASISDLLDRLKDAISPTPGGNATGFADGFKYLGYGVGALILFSLLRGRR